MVGCFVIPYFPLNTTTTLFKNIIVAISVSRFWANFLDLFYQIYKGKKK